MILTEKLHEDKASILLNLRTFAQKEYTALTTPEGWSYRTVASVLNTKIKTYSESLHDRIVAQSVKESWDKSDTLSNILMLRYCSYVVMLEFRHKVWPYEYMAFSRRIGELWEPFCRLCFEYPVIEGLTLIDSPKFKEVKQNLQDEISNYIDDHLEDVETATELKSYYDKVWGLVTSGEIKLGLDLHFNLDEVNYHVDFKSGFQSNEKGNTNRLLLVASIYKNLIGDNNECLLFVRAKEDDNNHYLQTLKKSGIWSVSCGEETYDKISEYSGFDLAGWIKENISWADDLNDETMDYFEQNDLTKYLTW